MGLFDRFRKKTVKTAEPKERPAKLTKSAKDIATEKGEPYVAILSLDINPNDINSGAFELDWNEKFIANLIRAGYQMRPNEPEDVIVDRWFQNVCRNVVMETWEQEQAMNPQGARFTQSRDIGNGRTEVS